MSRPVSENRLDGEGSPYLRLHADNPVHWQPWDEEARSRAHEHDVPIFLSIGYAACHWCHVMEEESFSDASIAAVLNEHFVPIKVDREERPAVDRIYQTICQLTSGRGGWPLSVWLTPDGRPFHVGTYFPPEPRRGMPGFGDVLEGLAGAWREDREEIEARADQWHRALEAELGRADPAGRQGDGEHPIGPPDTDGVERAEVQGSGDALLESAARAAVRSADGEHGGFGSGGPKFPQPHRLQLLLRSVAEEGVPGDRGVLERTLDAMVEGGLWDHVGWGFHRYCVDRDWTVPHFEKMLYDNAELSRTYLDAYRLTDEDRYRTVVERTLAFLDRELVHPNGGFYSTLDARSENASGEREEGAYYVLEPADVEAAVTDETDAALFRDRFGVTDAGNFEGATVPNVAASIESLAAEYDLEPPAVRERLERAREAVHRYREDRPRPPRDEKIIAAWNGLAIGAAADAGLALGDSRAEELATDGLSFVRTNLWDADAARLSRRWVAGEAGVEGALEDYAFLGRGALAVHELTGALEPLAFAIELADAIRERFWAADEGTLYFTPSDGEELVVRPQELRDQSTPSATGVTVALLDRLAPFGRPEYREIADDVLATHRQRIESSPLEYATMTVATVDRTAGPVEFTVAGETIPADWRRRIGAGYHPRRLLTRRPASEAELDDWLDRLGLEAAPPLWRDRETMGDEPTLYVCERGTCSPPTHDVEEALEWLAAGRH